MMKKAKRALRDSGEKLFPAAMKRNFRQRLLSWYGRHQRTLPWRGERRAYRIWISEIMLQQTRVAVVEQRYRRFMRRFPTLQTLARARVESVLAEWSGLGYYHRARNLHRTARQIVMLHRGRFPESSHELRALPGIGRYTASAVASIAFHKPSAVVDGNVERVLRRVFASRMRANGVEKYWKLAQELLSPRRPGDFNQAMMELGATVCLPGIPRCGECPLARCCAGRKHAASARKRSANPQRKVTQLVYAVYRRKRAVWLVQRSVKARLMPGLWELPQITHCKRVAALQQIELRHAITTNNYHVTAFLCDANERKLARGGRWKSLAHTERLPLTGLARKILRQTAVLR